MTGKPLPCGVLFLVCALCGAAAAADNGRDVVILVNAASTDSVAVGAHYAKARGVPDANICRVNCTRSESVSRKSFDAKVRAPVRAFLIEKGLAEKGPAGALALKVKYLVSTYGVPVKVREDYSDAALEDLPRNAHKASAAAVDSELSLIALPTHKLEGGLPNPLYRKPAADARTILLTSRLDGPTPEIAMGLVDAAIAAEKNGLAGVAYIDARGLKKGAYEAGDRWILSAGDAARKAGFFIRVDRAGETFHADMPMPHAALYFGWYSAAVCGPMARDDFRFAPGAVAYHLHSGSAARVRTTRIGWVGPLLEKGAAATMGPVFEPYLTGTVDTGEFARLFLAGKTFAESAHRATPQTSWMMTFIGDPLYAPFRPERREAALANERNRVWRDMRDAVLAAEKSDFDRAAQICSTHGSDPLFIELAARAHFQAGRTAEAAKLSRRLARAVGDEYSILRACGQLGDGLLACKQAPKALEAYIEGAAAHPKSPHALPLYRRALRLARALGKPKQEADLWRGLALNFLENQLGRFAAGELWARGLQKECPVPRLTVRRVRKAPVIDGQPGDVAWRAAPAVLELPNHAGPRRAVPRTHIWAAYDDAALYILADIRADPDDGAVNGGIAHDEAFELMLSPWRDAEQAGQIAVPRRGRAVTALTGVVSRVGAVRKKTPGGVRYEGWLVELKIPFAALGRKSPQKGAIWAANFVERNSVPQFPFRIAPSFRSWAKCGDDPLAADCGGYLIFE
ncbi:MAG: TIGR03790 family protein [Planctomycetota bacterium]